MDNMRTFLFLDCDGVMATDNYYNKLLPDGNCDFDPVAVGALNTLISQIPDLEIVISSTWRLGETVESFQRILNARGVIGGRVVGLTPRAMLLFKNTRTSTAPRGCEIEEYLHSVKEEMWPIHPELTMSEEYIWRNNYPYSYLILDDDGDMLYHQRKNFIQTRSRKGFRPKDVAKALKILKKPLYI